jgi:hypothetical protein
VRTFVPLLEAAQLDRLPARAREVIEYRKSGLQHALGFQMHDVRHPHHAHRHGRADTGWQDGDVT